MTNVREKMSNLIDIIKSCEKVIVAYSGGVDSTFLAKVACDTLKDKSLAVMAFLDTSPSRELNHALKMADILQLNYQSITIDQTKNKLFLHNTPKRCYHCKKVLFEKLRQLAEIEGYLQVFDGTNYDDRLKYRPGSKAAEEMSIRSPLKEAKLTKNEIRQLSKEMKIPTWNRISYTCLATRIPYGEKITLPALQRIEKAEDYLYSLGLLIFRVRHHDSLARIEVPWEKSEIILKNRKELIQIFKNIGYTNITLDLQGFRSGSMDEM
ncbi:ATP-dependent sacrificial sulfur transferase LarE [Candidatus Contubernalis alkaliaceticus]|uniref:ATP-dependent sacrificial sulfur transferase LarE n=1 Tax=Candidatus Contubernalis alkaliaceticus TaxID=338645 RepID=UPI001F4C2642|nr:ATP-dependent sacrificial sulfur transferase LarE [Candidatus Contubernalis alkalaceticus]UNC91364.1 ATP-dependent sacrificial sulfur transferase LarE [Candidatus Contubernalis alkalaceticus]